MDYSKNHNQHLGVNKLGKNIRKSPLHQPSFPNQRPPLQHGLHHQQQQPPAPPQPQVYNISKNDFRSLVQQLTGTPTRDPVGHSQSPPAPPAHLPQPKTPSMRLQKIRPPPLTPIARPLLPPVAAAPIPIPYQHPIPNANHVPRHPSVNPSFLAAAPSAARGVGSAWAESPVSAYVRYLESSLLSSDTSRHPQAQPQLQQQPPPHPLLPPPLPSPELLHSQGLPPLPSPRAFANVNSLPPTPQPSVLPSPSAFLNLLSPKSPYPLLSPGFQYHQPLTPNFAFSPLAQSAILGPGPGPGPQPPPSPGLLFPPSPSGFLPVLSPRWRDMM